MIRRPDPNLINDLNILWQRSTSANSHSTQATTGTICRRLRLRMDPQRSAPLRDERVYANIECAGARRRPRSVPEETEIAPRGRDGAERELVEDARLAFALHQFPVACADVAIASTPSRAGADGSLRRRRGVGFERGFGRRVPAPETVLIEVQPLPRSGELRDAHELIIAGEHELCSTAGLERR